MKTATKVKVIVALAIVILIAAVVNFFVIAPKRALTKAQAQFDQQVKTKWTKVLDAHDLLVKNCDSKEQFRNYCYANYKVAKNLKDFSVDQKYAEKFKPAVEEFADEVIYPAEDLFNSMSEPIVSDTSQMKDFIAKTTQLETKLIRYQNDHKELAQVVPNAEIFKNKIKKFYALPENRPSTQVIVLHEYPDWVVSEPQRAAYNTMGNVARRYFAERTRLNHQLNWQYGKQNPSYFAYSDVLSILASAISIRQGLYREVKNIESIQGMSSLAYRLEEMLENSYSGLRALYDNQDYSTFNYLNQKNNAIASRIRRQFGIR